MGTMTRSLLVVGPMLSILAGCAASEPNQTVMNPNTPGWTGRTVVMGSTSTVAGDAAATELQQKWGVGQQR